MGKVVKITSIIITLIVFTLSSNYGKTLKATPTTTDTNKGCADAKCQDPPSNAKCTRIADSNKSSSFPQPQGGGAECCPLWKCTAKNNTGKNGLFTFNGLLGDKGGQEIVRYAGAASRSKQGGTIYNVVSSVATGNHDAKALAGDAISTTKDMAEIQNVLNGFGLKY